MRRLLTLLPLLLLPVLPVAAQEKIPLSVAAAEATRDHKGVPVVNVTLDEDSGQVLADFTAEHVGKVIEILVNDNVVVAPMIMEPMPGNVFTISGSFSVSELDALAEVIGTASAPLFVRVQTEGRSK